MLPFNRFVLKCVPYTQVSDICGIVYVWPELLLADVEEQLAPFARYLRSGRAQSRASAVLQLPCMVSRS